MPALEPKSSVLALMVQDAVMVICTVRLEVAVPAWPEKLPIAQMIAEIAGVRGRADRPAAHILAIIGSDRSFTVPTQGL